MNDYNPWRALSLLLLLAGVPGRFMIWRSTSPDEIATAIRSVHGLAALLLGLLQTRARLVRPQLKRGPPPGAPA